MYIFSFLPVTLLFVLSPFVSLPYCFPSFYPSSNSLLLSLPDGECITGMAVESKLQLFFFFFPALLIPSPSLILVSCHYGTFNASCHMVSGSSWRCRGAFIGASNLSCNNARQGSWFFITLMLYQVEPFDKKSPPIPTPISVFNSFCFFLMLKPQIGLESFTGRRQSETTQCQWRDVLAGCPPQICHNFTLFSCKSLGFFHQSAQLFLWVELSETNIVENKLWTYKA